ncbi:hypothetical protein K3722_00480 [Leisingera caerulea]|uniref:Integron gene cassette protein n=1 Tax=Leisingera caerulea TaxID=506591 RepID=A0ABY5WWN9_LEICA|nr:hypothetical protein [Leisingera caerulea]UWQ58644.1 hypothetical protein K3722_00480 [Leisingera caerulea]
MAEEANYREISQQYAQGAIRAVVLVNSGAAVALLSQMTGLLAVVPKQAVGWAFVAFIFGVFFGCIAWLCGFYNARFVDLTIRGQLPSYDVANRWQHWGVGLLVVGLLCFLAGCLSMAWQFICPKV